MDVDEQAENGISSPRPLSPLPRPLPFDHEILEEQAGSSRHHKRLSIASDSDYTVSGTQPHSVGRSRPSISGPKRIPTAVRTALPMNMLPSAPASPPTPAPSPTPFQRQLSWAEAGPDEDSVLRDTRHNFLMMGESQRQRFLAEILNMCTSNQLSFVAQFVSPRLKKDPFEHLPDELCLRVCFSGPSDGTHANITRYYALSTSREVSRELLKSHIAGTSLSTMTCYGKRCVRNMHTERQPHRSTQTHRLDRVSNILTVLAQRTSALLMVRLLAPRQALQT